MRQDDCRTGKLVKECERGMIMSIFDFNRDGKVDLMEHFFAYETFQSINNKVTRSNSNNYDTDWRGTCEDGSDYGLDPYDYDTEEEYMDALEDERYYDYDDFDGFDF